MIVNLQGRAGEGSIENGVGMAKTAVVIVNHGTTDLTEAIEGLHQLYKELKHHLPEGVTLYSAIANDVVLDYVRQDINRKVRTGTDAVSIPVLSQELRQEFITSTMSVREACERAVEDQPERILIFPTIMIYGPMYDKMLREVHEATDDKVHDVRIMPPVLNPDSLESSNRAATLIEKALKIHKNDRYILIGYETDHAMRPMYHHLREAFLEKGLDGVHVVCLEDREGLTMVAADLRKVQYSGTIVIQPLATNTNGHVLEEDSGDAKTVAEMFRRFGFQVKETHKGLACYPEYRKGLIRSVMKELKR